MTISTNFIDTGEMVEPTPQRDEPIYHMGAMREHRDKLLLGCDWTQASDSPLSDEKKAEWATYRQQLRDLPSSGLKLPDAEGWPTPPSA
jgi:hypothetical protein